MPRYSNSLQWQQKRGAPCLIMSVIKLATVKQFQVAYNMVKIP